MKPVNQTVLEMKPSGIRKFFDLANSMKGVISLGVGEPDFNTPWHISEYAVMKLQDGHTHYTANRGLLELREEIARYHHDRFQMDYDPAKEILVTVGGSEAVDLCLRALINPGDEVIVLDPNYVAYEPIIRLAGGIPKLVELTWENDFKLTPEMLKSAITEKTKALLINFPSNPTGGVMTREDYEKIVPIIKESDIYVISDEIYAELTFDEPFASPAQFDEIKDQVLVINGFSKAFAMTGWRLGYVLANREISSLLTKIHQYVIMSAPTQAQHAAIEALRSGMDDVEMMRNDYEQRRNLICARLNRMGLATNVPHGTFYVFPNITSTGMTSDEFCTRLLEEEKVAVVPGTAFGDHGEGFVRISYATSMDSIKEACRRIERFLARHRPEPLFDDLSPAQETLVEMLLEEIEDAMVE